MMQALVNGPASFVLLPSQKHPSDPPPPPPLRTTHQDGEWRETWAIPSGAFMGIEGAPCSRDLQEEQPWGRVVQRPLEDPSPSFLQRALLLVCFPENTQPSWSTQIAPYLFTATGD